jgi:hypothetical protein
MMTQSNTAHDLAGLVIFVALLLLLLHFIGLRAVVTVGRSVA